MHQAMEQLPNVRWLGNRRPPARPRPAGGFTLIELMVTVAIVAILAAIAYPSYTAYIVRSNRAAAQGYMLEVTSLQQRYLLDARSYASDLATLNSTVPSNVAPNYDVVPTATNTTKPPSFKITATPKGSQAARDTTCGTLGIDETGQKTALSGQTGVVGCW